MASSTDDVLRGHTIEEIENWNLDRTVDPPTKVMGIMGCDSTGAWNYLGSDAGKFRVSALGTFALSADAVGNRVSALSPDAATFRVSAIGGTAGDNTLVDGTTHTISATLTPISANPATTIAGLVAHANQPDAARLRISAILDNGSVSAKSGDANQVHVSAVQGDAGLLHVSAIGTVATSVDSGSISAKSADANQLHVSSVQGDAGLLHVSAYFSQRLDAGNDAVSCKSNDGALLRVSALPAIDTVGRYSVHRSLNLSASQAIKATAGALYGYYLYNTATIPNYVKFFNTSGAINVGTDVPVLTLMVPASAAANMEFAGGLIGFTAGIGIAALSAVADNATTVAAASAVGGNIFYK